MADSLMKVAISFGLLTGVIGIYNMAFLQSEVVDRALMGFLFVFACLLTAGILMMMWSVQKK